MATNTTNLGLSKPSIDDNVADTIPSLASNFQKIDDKIGQVNESLVENMNQFLSANLSKTITKLNRGESVNVLFIGDSTTEVNVVNPNHVQMVIDKIKVLYPNATINVTNTAKSGRSIKWANENIYNNLIQYNPDIVCICFGINDATIGGDFYVSPTDFEKYYKLVLDMIVATLPNCEIIIRTPNVTGSDFSYEKNARMVSDYVPIMKKVAALYSTGFLDTFYYWKSLLDSGSETQATLTYDNTHPNTHGQTLIADKYLELFKNSSIYNNAVLKSRKFYWKPDSRIMIAGHNSFFEEISSANFYGGKSFQLIGDSTGLNNYSIPFFGESISVSYSRVSTGAIVDVYVDDVKKATIDSGSTPTTDTLWNITELVADNLTKDWHMLKIVITGRNQYNTTKYDFYLAGLITSEYQTAQSILERNTVINTSKENKISNSTFEFKGFKWTLAGGAVTVDSITDSYVGGTYIDFPVNGASINQVAKFNDAVTVLSIPVMVYVSTQPQTINLTVYLYDSNSVNVGTIQRKAIIRQTGWQKVYFNVPVTQSTARQFNITLANATSTACRIGSIGAYEGLGERTVNRDSKLIVYKNEDVANIASKNIAKPSSISTIYSVIATSKSNAKVYITTIAASQFTVQSDVDNTGFIYEIRGI